MIFVKRNKILMLISLLAIAFFQYNQLKFLPVPMTTRPISQIFIFLFFIIIFIHTLYYRSNDCLEKYYFKNKYIYKWIPFISITFIYSFISIVAYVNIIPSLKFIINVFLAFLFYWYGFTRMGLRKEKFIRYNLFFSLPILIVGSIEVVGLVFDKSFYYLIDVFRDIILSINLKTDRLHLLFSEPSFLATYILFLLFLVKNSNIGKYKKYIFYFFILIFAMFSKSINTIIVLTTFFIGYYLFYLKKNIIIKLIFFFPILIGVIAISYFLFKNRILNTFYDPSIYIRFVHLKVLSEIIINTYGLGIGFGKFGEYFINYLNNNFILIWTEEFSGYLNGARIVPYSMLLSIFAQTGILGGLSFLYIFKSIFSRFNKYKHFQLALLIATLTALPWGLPFIWALLGMIDRDIEERKILNATTIKHNYSRRKYEI